MGKAFCLCPNGQDCVAETCPPRVKHACLGPIDGSAAISATTTRAILGRMRRAEVARDEAVEALRRLYALVIRLDERRGFSGWEDHEGNAIGDDLNAALRDARAIVARHAPEED